MLPSRGSACIGMAARSPLPAVAKGGRSLGNCFRVLSRLRSTAALGFAARPVHDSSAARAGGGTMRLERVLASRGRSAEPPPAASRGRCSRATASAASVTLAVTPASRSTGLDQFRCCAATLRSSRSTDNHDHAVRKVRDFQSNPPGYDHLVFRVADIEAAERHLLANGIGIEDSGEMPIGPGEVGRYLRFKDPEGNLVGFMQRSST